jgi:hypothetical protein
MAIGADLGGQYGTKEEQLAKKELEKLNNFQKAAMREMQEAKAQQYEMALIQKMADKQAQVQGQSFMNSATAQNFTVSGTGTYFNGSETTQRVKEYKTRTIRKNYKGGYYVLIKVYEDTDEVYYSINRGRGWKWMTWYAPWWDFQWKLADSRDTLESTLGAMYLKVDTSLESMNANKKHAKFVKDILKTDPDNLKMISELDKLDKAGKDPAPKASSGVSSTACNIQANSIPSYKFNTLALNKKK